MFKLDDNLLQELGLSGLPPAEKNKMLAHIYETLEMRVGMVLAESMSTDQLDEFERFIEGDLGYARSFLDRTKPAWESSPEYQSAMTRATQQATKQGKTVNEGAVISEFGALSWLETNFPDYKKVVAYELEKLKTEIIASADQILEASKE